MLWASLAVFTDILNYYPGLVVSRLRWQSVYPSYVKIVTPNTTQHSQLADFRLVWPTVLRDHMSVMAITLCNFDLFELGGRETDELEEDSPT